MRCLRDPLRQQLPKLGIFKETHTVTFATQAIREQMRKTTRQTATTDEQLISTKGNYTSNLPTA